MPKEDEQSKPVSPPPERKRDSDARVPTPPPEQRRLRGYDRLEEVAFTRVGVLPVNAKEPQDLGPVAEEPPSKDPSGPKE